VGAGGRRPRQTASALRRGGRRCGGVRRDSQRRARLRQHI